METSEQRFDEAKMKEIAREGRRAGGLVDGCAAGEGLGVLLACLKSTK